MISWEIPTNGGETLAVVLAILFGFALPMSTTQILWVNLVLAATLGLVLAFEPPEPDVMRRRPRRRDAPLLSPFLLWRVVIVSVLLTIASLVSSAAPVFTALMPVKAGRSVPRHPAGRCPARAGSSSSRPRP